MCFMEYPLLQQPSEYSVDMQVLTIQSIYSVCSLIYYSLLAFKPLAPTLSVLLAISAHVRLCDHPGLWGGGVWLCALQWRHNGAMASQITSLTIVYSIVYSGADQRKHQSFASLIFVRGIHWWPVNSPHKGQWRGKCFHLMTSSCGHFIKYIALSGSTE